MQLKILTTLLLTLSPLINIFAATGHNTGENISGLNKVCYYSSVNGTFTKTVSAVSLCPLSADDGRGGNTGLSNGGGYSQQSQSSTMGQLSGENVSGFNKTCYYTSVRGTFTKTVNSVALCPLTARQ